MANPQEPNNCAVEERPVAGYIVQNKLTHTRLLPKESTHSFSYSTPYLLASLNALEAKELDLWGGWLFGYGGISWRVTGLREATYLQPAAFPGQRIKQKIEVILERKGYNLEELADVWTLSMPAYFGYDGMNPLTVYYAYKTDGSPWLVILEIHNTFYERHTHILEVNEQNRQAKKSSKGYDYYWSFSRDFHVSPFNDRSGFYGVSITLPFDHLPSPSEFPSLQPRARVRIDLHTATASSPTVMGPIKLSAFIDPFDSAPFTSSNLLNSLAKQPFVLFMAWSRILYNAWVLHYVKRLDVFVRPDPKPAVPDWAPVDSGTEVSGSIGWQEETWTEAFARKRVAVFLRKRVQELDVEVILKPANPATPTQHFAAAGRDLKSVQTLVISHLSSTLFTTLLMTPSASHALTVGEADGQFVVSSKELFLQIFGGEVTPSPALDEMSFSQRWRVRQIPASNSLAHRDILNSHPLDPADAFAYILTFLVMLYVSLLDRFTESMYGLMGARFVKGQEPWSWRVWERATGHGQVMDSYLQNDVVRRDGQEEYNLGSVRRVL